MTTQQQFLRDTAINLKLTQKELAQRMNVPWATFEKWLAPEGSKSFREMPQMAWRLVRTVVENNALSNRLNRFTNPPMGGTIENIELDDEDCDMDEFETSKRDILIAEHLRSHGIYNIEDAPDELLDEASDEADKVLGKGKNN